MKNKSITAQTKVFNNLTIGEAVDGIIKCLENSEGLLKSAIILFKEEQNYHAINLLLVSLEEVAKARWLLHAIIYPPTSNQFKNEAKEMFNNIFKNHTFKQAYIMTHFAFMGIKDFTKNIPLSELKKLPPEILFDLIRKLTKDFNEARKNTLYVKFDEQRKFISPREAIQENHLFKDKSDYQGLLDYVEYYITESRGVIGKNKDVCLDQAIKARLGINKSYEETVDLKGISFIESVFLRMKMEDSN